MKATLTYKTQFNHIVMKDLSKVIAPSESMNFL